MPTYLSLWLLLVNGIISPQEVRRLIASANCLRDCALFELLYVTGMRIHEALGLTWDDIYNNGGDWYVHILGKGHKTRHNNYSVDFP